MTETELQEIEKLWTSDFFIGYSKSDLETLAKKDIPALLSTVRELQRQAQEREAEARRYRWLRDWLRWHRI